MRADGECQLRKHLGSALNVENGMRQVGMDKKPFAALRPPGEHDPGSQKTGIKGGERFQGGINS